MYGCVLIIAGGYSREGEISANYLVVSFVSFSPSPLCQAAIVRVMKARKELNIDDLQKVNTKYILYSCINCVLCFCGLYVLIFFFSVSSHCDFKFNSITAVL